MLLIRIIDQVKGAFDFLCEVEAVDEGQHVFANSFFEHFLTVLMCVWQQ